LAQRGAAIKQKKKDESTIQPFASRIVQATKYYPNLHPGAVEPVDPGNVFRLNSFANQYRLHKVNSHGVNVPNQQYNFVRTREGEMLLHSRYRHPSIAEGKQVLYAGEIFFNNGQLESALCRRRGAGESADGPLFFISANHQGRAQAQKRMTGCMNPTNRRPSVAQSLAQKVKQPKQPAPAFKPVVAQVKTVPSAQSAKRPVAAPVYKPQAKPVTAQPKNAGLLQRQTHPIAPIAYRPQPTPRVLQAKAVSRQPSAIGPLSSPVYRPQSLPGALQTKKVGETGVVKPPFASSTRSNTTNTIQRSIDPTFAVAGVVVGAAVVGGLLYRRWNQQPEAREKKY
jgi:hypothetical protein